MARKPFAGASTPDLGMTRLSVETPQQIRWGSGPILVLPVRIELTARPPRQTPREVADSRSTALELLLRNTGLCSFAIGDRPRQPRGYKSGWGCLSPE